MHHGPSDSIRSVISAFVLASNASLTCVPQGTRGEFSHELRVCRVSKTYLVGSPIARAIRAALLVHGRCFPVTQSQHIDFDPPPRRYKPYQLRLYCASSSATVIFSMLQSFHDGSDGVRTLFAVLCVPCAGCSIEWREVRLYLRVTIAINGGRSGPYDAKVAVPVPR